MISTDFAANEAWDDAWLSLKLLFQPWKWKKGDGLRKSEKLLFSKLQITNNKYQISFFLSGRSALYYLVKSLNLPKNSEAIVQAFTCEAVVLPVLANNLKPVYIDIEKKTYSMDNQSLINRLTDNSKILILQHTFGLTPQYREKILKLAEEKGLIVIEDLAHGFHESIFKTDNRLPTTDHYYLLSFGRSKLLSSVFGGAVITKSNEAMKQWSNLKYPSYSFIFRCLLYKPLTMFIKSTYDIYLGKIIHKLLDYFKLLIPEITNEEKAGEYSDLFNKAYPNALSLLLINQLNKFEKTQNQRKKICQVYQRHLANNNNQLTINDCSLIRLPLLVDNRKDIIDKAKKQSIYLGLWYDQVVAPKDLNLGRVGYSKGSCPIAEEISKKIINLPTKINEQDAKKIINYLSREKSRD